MAIAQANTQSQAVEWEDVQGIVLRGYGKHAFSVNIFLRVDDAAQAKAWLASSADRVTTADRAKTRIDQCYFNIAFTPGGLNKLGMPELSIQGFPTAFVEGMTSDYRSRILGDQDGSSPTHWLWGGPGMEVDAIILIFAVDEPTLNQALAAELAGLKGLSPTIIPVITQLSDNQREHFGFHDGISQPIIEGSPPPLHSNDPGPTDGNYNASNTIKAGEFLLGYLNEYDVLPDSVGLPLGADPNHILPTVPMLDGSVVPDLGRNGTYLVVRQVAQHVPQLWNYLDEATKDPSGASNEYEREKLGAKLVGRWPSGAPMAVAPQKDDPTRAEENEFLYRDKDPNGFGCPFGSHTRRANPRDMLGDDPVEALKLTKRHRLIRRGRSFGPRAANKLDLTDTQERGLMFMAINANIERQFEFVQQTWINGPSFNGLYNERDPIFGNFGDQKSGTMTIPGTPVRRKLHDLGGFVTVRGGAYFFLPGIRALRYLATMT
jgi:Dyp-type peroxidase family